MASSFQNVSIVVPTLNNAAVLQRVLHAMLKLDYPKQYEIIVVNDGSTDGTREMLQREFGKEKRVKIINQERGGVCRARNAGIKEARFPIVVNMDHDCIPSKRWLHDLVSGFKGEKVGAVSSFGAFGGTSTAFRKRLLAQVGGYDEAYRYYREDTDLTFKIMDLGYEYNVVKADYEHDHKMAAPKGLLGNLGYFLQRMRYHENDVLLYKKHPKLAAEFLDVKMGFLVNPAKDFRVAANLWEGSSRELKLCSPRGIVLIRNKSPVHALAIILAATGYLFSVKFFRLVGSIRFGKLLI